MTEEIPSRSIAKVISEMTFPAVTVAVALLVCAILSAEDFWLGARDWAISATFTAGLPTLFVALGVRRGKLSGHQVPQRSQRLIPIVFTLTSAIVGLILLVLVNAAEPIVELYTSGVLLGAVLGAITLRTKVSAHAGILVGAIVALAMVSSIWALAAIPLLAPVWWARRVLSAHTNIQLLVGVTAGVIVPIATILLFRLM